MQDYLNGLNERQKEAALHINGPLMIVAGAGSGKTKVLTYAVLPILWQMGVGFLSHTGTYFYQQGCLRK
jgi:ATP-dependent exoDNAse (exonuclease V) beta subunit